MANASFTARSGHSLAVSKGLSRPHNAAVQRPRADVSSAQQAHNEMARLLRARDAVSRSAATACSATRSIDPQVPNLCAWQDAQAFSDQSRRDRGRQTRRLHSLHELESCESLTDASPSNRYAPTP